MSTFWLFRTRGLRDHVGVFALGFILVVLELELRLYLNPETEGPTLIFFMPAIMLIASIGGFWSGLLTTLMSCACADYYLLPPIHSFGLKSSLELTSLTVFALTGLFVTTICALLRETIRNGEAANAELVQAHKAATQLAAIVEGSSDAIIGKTLEGVITSWNKTSATMFGYSSAEAIGAHVSMLIPPSLLAEEEFILAEIAQGHTISPFETKRLHKDGSIIDVSATVSPVRDAHGVVIGASKVIRDITACKRAQSEVQTTRVKLEAALRCMIDAVSIFDGDGHLVHVNDAFATFHRFQNVSECFKMLEEYPALFELLTPDGKPVPFDRWPVSKALAGETTIGDEYVVRRRDTGATWFGNYTFAPIRDESGKITGSVVTARDVTAQKENEARLESMRAGLVRAGRLSDLGQMSAGLAHELNQPLAAIHNYSNVAKRLMANGESSTLAKAYDAISKAADQAVRAGEIIGRLRALIGKRETSRAFENINSIVEESMAVALVGTQAEGLTTHLDLAFDSPPVFADRIQIQQVLANLLRNALEAMADSPKRELTISTKAMADGAVEIAVTDTGSGIANKLADNLFMPFVTTKPGGMGIGLVISQSIVEAHGGRIHVEPNPGGGTRFTFRLPSTPVVSERSAA